MLCANLNDTYAMIDLKAIGYDDVLGLRGRNEIVGNIGGCVDNLLIKKALRKCRILGNLIIGEKLANSTYTGIFGQIQSGQVDLYLRGEPDYLDESWMQKSVPIHMESVTLLHIIRDRNGIAYFNLLDNFKVGFSLISVYLFTSVGILAFSFLFNELARRIQSGGEGTIRFARRGRTEGISKRIARAMSSFGVKRLSAIGVFVLFVHLFIWVTQLFLTNNVKTNKVVVDTSQLVKDENDAFSTKKVACMLGSGQLANLIFHTPIKTIPSRLFYEKTRLRPDMQKEREILGDDRCLISSNRRMFQIVDSDVMVIGERSIKDILLSVSVIFNDVKIFGQNRLYEYPLALYYSVKKPWFGKMILRHFENGMISAMFDCFDEAAMTATRNSKTSLFESLESYIEEFSGFSDLALENFRYIFLYYTLLCSLAFVAFLVHHLVKCVRKHFAAAQTRRMISFGSLLRSLIERLTHGTNPQPEFIG